MTLRDTTIAAVTGCLALGLPVEAASTVQVATFAELESAIESCSSTLAANKTVEITTDITVTDTLKIGKGTQGLTLRSTTGNRFKLSPGGSHKDSTLTIGSFCGSGTITDLRIENVEFTGVTQINGGITLGPVYVGGVTANSTITFDNVHFTDNLSPNIGSLSPSGLRIDDGTVTISNSVFDNNDVNDGIGGGGLFTGGSSIVTVTGTTFQNNGDKPALGGGAAYIKGDATFTSCTFKKNTVAKKGGAVALDASSSKTVTFTDCTFEENVATDGGNDLYLKSSNHIVTFTPCTASLDCVSDDGNGCPCDASTNPANNNLDGLDDLTNAALATVGAVVGLALPVIIGIAVGGFVAFCVIIGCCVYCCCFRNRKNRVEMVQGETKVVVVHQRQPGAQPPAPTYAAAAPAAE